MDPADRDLLLQFLWTRDFEDAIDSPEKLRDWLAGLGLIGASEPVSEADVALARHFRAATRNLCAVNNGAELDPRTQGVIGQLNGVAPLKVTVGAGGTLAVEASGNGVLRALSTLLAVSYKATAAGEFARFKTCKACGLPYYDSSKNGSRVWCAMGACGTKHKMRAYRARKASGEK
jgi:predicted RNA-binding Zn ribbon-like protein